MLRTWGRPSADFQIWCVASLSLGTLSCKFWPPWSPQISNSVLRQRIPNSENWLSSARIFSSCATAWKPSYGRKLGRWKSLCVFLSLSNYLSLPEMVWKPLIHTFCLSVCHFGCFMGESISSSYCSLAGSENPSFPSNPFLSFVEGRTVLGTWLVHSLELIHLVSSDIQAKVFQKFNCQWLGYFLMFNNKLL